MTVMLDTNAVIDILDNHQTVENHIRQHRPQNVVISCIVQAELFFGVKTRPQADRSATEQFMKTFEILPWDHKAARCYGALKHELLHADFGLKELDLQIAAHAISIQADLISSDKALLKLHQLKVIDWRVP